MMQSGKINIMMGISFGSEGKGNISAYVGRKYDLDFCIANNTPNAGHQFMTEGDGGEPVETIKMLPVAGIVAKNATIFLGSGSGIDVARLLEEVNKFGVSNRLIISPNAPIVDEKCKQYERDNLQYIASTFQGSGAAMGLKAMRSKDLTIARDCPELAQWVKKDYSDIILEMLNNGETGVMEICQGYGLSVDSQFYPYCTSRPVNVGQALAYIDAPVSTVGDVIGIARSYIIRVGNVPNGVSGDTYEDSHELTWEQVSARVGRPVKELTTVTKRVRRVFTFSKTLFEMAVRRNGVNVVFITFCDYLSAKEKDDMKEYLTGPQFNFKNIYFVSGFGDFNSNIEQVK